MKIALIANSRSKEVKNQNLSPDLEKKLLERNIRFDLFTTQYHGHAFEMVKQVSIGEYDAIVTMGGDGTNYQVLNGLLKYHGDKQLPPMGILPVGRGNSFARDLQIFSIEDGISALGRQATRKVDVCRFSQDKDAYYFVNLMGFGFVTDVAKTAARFKWA
ncbi:MAG: acylglycerol kinase family protein, partial [Desulfobacterales bacterium]